MLGVAAQVDERARLYLAVDVGVVAHRAVLLAVFALELHGGALRDGDHPEVQHQRNDRDDQRPEEVGPHEAAEAHAAREHGDDLGLVGHLRGEEDHGDEGEQAAELVDEEGYEVEVVVEDDGLDRRLQLREVVDLLHIVEDHHHHDDHRDGEKVGFQEFSDDVSVQYLESRPANAHNSPRVTVFCSVLRPLPPSRV